MTILPDNKNINKLLQRRIIAVEGADFSDRIIHASRKVIQRKNVTIIVWLRRIFTELSLPTPAYALASILVIGLLLGIAMQDFGASDSNNIASIDSIFNEESIL